MIPLILAGPIAAAPAPAAAPGSRSGPSAGPIVVVGRSPERTGAALAACLARRCPPREDVAATLEHADALFLAGDYPASRRVLHDGIRRDDHYAAQYPREVAALYQGHARLSAHLGEPQEYRISTYGAVQALRAGLPPDAPEVLMAEIDAADMRAQLGDRDALIVAMSKLRGVEARAGKAPQPVIAALARFHLALLDEALLLPGDARRRYAAIAADAGSGPVAGPARVALARLDLLAGKPGAMTALRGAMATQPTQEAVLLRETPLYFDEIGEFRAQSDGDVINRSPAENVEDKWADIGFWINGDGTVADVQVLRAAHPGPWTAPILRNIGQRGYAPLAGGVGQYHVERYTLTAWLETATGTHIPRRSPQLRLQRVDLTVAAPPAARGGSAGGDQAE